MINIPQTINNPPMQIRLLFTSLCTLCFATSAYAEPINPLDPGVQKLVSTQRLLQPQDNVVSAPIYYNFDQKVGLAHKGSTQYTEIEPFIPYRLSSEYSFVVHPQITYQSFSNFDGYSGSGLKPIIIQSYFTQSDPNRRVNSFGIGPMLQIRTTMPWMFGSSQNGAGYSVGAAHRTENWVYSLYGYQSFGLGATPTMGPSANNIYLQPAITYITKRYGNITLNSESTINMNTGAHSYPVNLMGSRLISIGDVPLLFTLGVRYYTVNTNIGGAQGWGGRLGITYAFNK
jgi:hypothetical protein